MSVFAAKQAELTAKIDEAEALNAEMSSDPAKKTEENQKKFNDICDIEIPALQTEVKRLNDLVSVRSTVPVVEEAERKAVESPAQVEERFTKAPTIGEQLINSAAYKTIADRIGPGGHPGQGDVNFGFDAKGLNLRDIERKATFNLSGTGLDSSRNYIPGVVQIEQQRLYVRDLLSVGETSQNIVYFIKESSYTNAAAATAEEGEKPEATFATTTASAAVKKIAVVAKVTDEMWSDFPMLRDYVNTRLRFMVEQTEEDELLNGVGTGNHLTGILQTSGIQTIAVSGSVLDTIHKAITKIRTPAAGVGGYEPDGIVMHPTDYQIIRLAKDDNNQYFGGGPYAYGPYGNGGYQDMPGPWGLRTVVTTAITAGTALVGAYKLGAQIWQREGIRVDSTNTNEDDFNFNRISLRVEERLALTVYRPSAFCTVTSVA